MNLRSTQAARWALSFQPSLGLGVLLASTWSSAVLAEDASSASTPPASPGFAPLLSPASACEISVRTADDTGAIFIDGELRGEGSFDGLFLPGRHSVRVERVGYDPFEKGVACAAGDVHVESVLLQPSLGLSPAPRESTGAEVETDGIYGGVQLIGAFQPGGSGSTLDDACESTGATRCSGGSGAGGGLHGYVGWMIAPLGLELALFGAGDITSPSATFDGETGSDINPLVATPAREESFTIGRFGGGAALRGRFVKQISRFRFAIAAGPGIVYRYLVMKRDTRAEGGLSGEIADTGTGYLSPMLSVELAGQLVVSDSLAVSLGVLTWLEHAGSDVESAARDGAVLLGGERPVRQATPAYDMASGTQWFIGPFLGLAFGA